MQFKSLALALAALVGGASAISQEVAEYALHAEFKAFEAKFGKAHSSAELRESKFWTFVQNLEDVVSKNAALKAEGKDEVHSTTKFADVTKDEFAAKMLTFRPAEANLTGVPVMKPTKEASGSTFDWRDSGVVTPVKNQAYCGSCWAFSATETVESQYAIAGNTLTELSVQQTVSCDTTDDGCGGGWYYTAWMDYMAPNGGLTTESNYPYDSQTAAGTASTCNTAKEAQVTSGTTPSSDAVATPTCQSFSCNNQDEDTLKANLVSYGPISIAADASEWSSYTGGVLTSSSCSSSGFKLDHAIQLVGYNEDASTPYWIVRNSWDTTWGEDGYIYLEMGSNTCGMADMAYMVTL